MNTISLLLGLMSVLLIGSFAWIFKSMSDETKPGDTQALEAEIRSLQAEMAQLDQMRLAPAPAAAPFQPNPAVVPTTNAGNSMPTLPDTAAQEEADLAAMKAEQAALAGEEEVLDEALAEDALALEDPLLEEEVVLDEAQMSRRAKLIRSALLTAKVTEVAPEGYAGIQIVRQDGVQEQQTLAVRRGDGIAGRVQVTKMYGAGVAAVDPIPGSFMGGNPTLQVGDELIVPPFN